MDDYNNISNLINTLEKYFEHHNYKAAISRVNDYDFSSTNEEYYEKLVNFFCTYINEKTERKDIHLFITSKTLLNTVSEKFNPQTVILQLIHDVPESIDDITFLSLIEPLQRALLRISKRHVSFLAWSLNSIEKYLEKIEVPDEYNLSNEEKVLMDADPLVDKTTHLLMDLMTFYDPLVEDVIDSKEWKIVLSGFILKLLGKPLGYLDLTSSNSKGRARRVAELVVEKYVKLERDIFLLMDPTYFSVNEDIPYDQFAIAVLFYLILVEHVSIEAIPKIYDRVFIFQNALHLVVKLFSENAQFLIQKGLDLANKLLANVSDVSLSYNLLDSSVHNYFCRNLVSLIIYNNNENYRKQGLNVLHIYINQFEGRGRYLVIYNLINIVNHTGLISYLITEYKEMLVKELDRSKEGEISEYFSGQKLINILNKICFLHKQEESDLVELADQIIASLNFLRFLIIRDKTNVTKVWDVLPKLEGSFFEPLKKGLMLSRAHYELKIKEVNEEKQDLKTNDNVTITVAGETLPEMPKSEKLKVLNSSLTAFDVIESLLSRVTELINNSPLKREN